MSINIVVTEDPKDIYEKLGMTRVCKPRIVCFNSLLESPEDRQKRLTQERIRFPNGSTPEF